MSPATSTDLPLLAMMFRRQGPGPSPRSRSPPGARRWWVGDEADQQGDQRGGLSSVRSK